MMSFQKSLLIFCMSNLLCGTLFAQLEPPICRRAREALRKPQDALTSFKGLRPPVLAGGVTATNEVVLSDGFHEDPSHLSGIKFDQKAPSSDPTVLRDNSAPAATEGDLNPEKAYAIMTGWYGDRPGQVDDQGRFTADQVKKGDLYIATSANGNLAPFAKYDLTPEFKNAQRPAQLAQTDKAPQLADSDRGARGGIYKLSDRELANFSSNGVNCPIDSDKNFNHSQYRIHWMQNYKDADSSLTIQNNDILCVKTRDGSHYALMKVIEICKDTVVFDYRYNGSSAHFSPEIKFPVASQVQHPLQ